MPWPSHFSGDTGALPSQRQSSNSVTERQQEIIGAEGAVSGGIALLPRLRPPRVDTEAANQSNGALKSYSGSALSSLGGADPASQGEAPYSSHYYNVDPVVSPKSTRISVSPKANIALRNSEQIPPRLSVLTRFDDPIGGQADPAVLDSARRSVELLSDPRIIGHDVLSSIASSHSRSPLRLPVISSSPLAVPSRKYSNADEKSLQPMDVGVALGRSPFRSTRRDPVADPRVVSGIWRPRVSEFDLSGSRRRINSDPPLNVPNFLQTSEDSFEKGLHRSNLQSSNKDMSSNSSFTTDSTYRPSVAAAYSVSSPIPPPPEIDFDAPAMHAKYWKGHYFTEDKNITYELGEIEDGAPAI
jgi:hypothetical protein